MLGGSVGPSEGGGGPVAPAGCRQREEEGPTWQEEVGCDSPGGSGVSNLYLHKAGEAPG